MTGTGTDMSTEQFNTTPPAGDPMMEDPATLRRRLMPIAGQPNQSTDALSVMRQALAPPNAPKWNGNGGGY